MIYIFFKLTLIININNNSIKSSLRLYHKKVMELPDQPIEYHSNIHNLYSNNESDKELIPNIPEQDIEDVSFVYRINFE